MKKCPFCKEENQDNAITCENCGRDLTVLDPPLKKRRALRTALIGGGFMLLAFIVPAIEDQMEPPTTKLGALLPGLITGLLGWTAIILFIIAIFQAVRNRKAK